MKKLTYIPRHVERMLREYVLLTGKLEALTKFLDELAGNTDMKERLGICDEEMADLEVQHHHMSQYKNTLNSRIFRAISINPDELDYPHMCTRGSQIIGKFNPTENPGVQEIKSTAIDLIDAIETYVGAESNGRKQLAFEHIEIGAMFGVKAIFQKD